MSETVYVLLSKNDFEKIIEVKQETFAFGSKEAAEAKQKEKELLLFAKTKHYKIMCDGKVIYMDDTRQELERLYEQKEWYEGQKKNAMRLSEIKKKDLLDLTEEEIRILAQSRVHGERTTAYSKTMGTTFEGEYNKIVKMIEQKKEEKKSRI